VVPCSFLTLSSTTCCRILPCSTCRWRNEGDAVALDRRSHLGWPPRRVDDAELGFGNAVSPLTSLTWTFRLPQLLIVTWRAQRGVHDEPQHALMGPITPKMLETMEIPWSCFLRKPPILAGIGSGVAHMDSTGRPYALVMQKGTVAPYALRAGAGGLLVHVVP